MDTTPLGLIAVLAVIAVLVWIALELRQANKYGRQKHYSLVQNHHITNNAEIYRDTKEKLDAINDSLR